MKSLLAIMTVFAVIFACGQKVKVEDSDHDVNIKAGICDVFDDPEERKDCVRAVLKALDKEKDCD